MTTEQSGSWPVSLETSVSKAFMAQVLGVSFDRDYYFDPLRRREIDARCHRYAGRELRDLDAFFTESNLGRRSFYAPDQVPVGGIQPNLILGMLLGAEFLPAPQGDADISPACWAGKPAGQLPEPPSLLEHPLIGLFDRQIDFVRQQERQVPIPPFFWDGSGRAAVHGALTTAQKFLGEQVFLDLATDPERVRQAMDWITEANIVLVRHFAERCGIRLQEIHVGECSSCMVGGPAWEEFVVPTLSRMATEMGPVRLHSCGRSRHLLPAFRQVPGLCSLDLGDEACLPGVRQLWGAGFPVSLAPPVKLLSGGSLPDWIDWTERVLKDNGGGCLTILYHLEPPYPLETLRAWRTWLEQRLARVLA